MDKQELIKGVLIFFSMTSIMFILGCTSQPVRLVNDSGWTSGGVDLVVNSNNQFAFDLYKIYNSNEENIFFSPYSISTAFAVLQEGVRGETAEDKAPHMRNVLRSPPVKRSKQQTLCDHVHRKAATRPESHSAKNRKPLSFSRQEG